MNGRAQRQATASGRITTVPSCRNKHCEYGKNSRIFTLSILSACGAITALDRKLAAILSADVAGFSRLTALDEEGTLRALDLCRSRITKLVNEHGGRIFGRAGDGLVAEFPSAVQAVRCSVEIQRELLSLSDEIPPDNRLEFRIGVNLGDVVISGDDLLGDGVNIAARLQEIAVPSGICIAASVREHLDGKVPFALTSLGDRVFKNIPRLIHVFQVDWQQEASAGRGIKSVSSPVIDCWTERPSIAVLPFETGAPDQEWFSDGVAEDITTALAKSRRLLVVSKNYSFAYKGRRDIRGYEIARELRVRYLLEGSVRLSGQRVRVSTRLLEGATGELLWAERFDREFANVFAIQDEITDAVVQHLELELLPEERRAIQRTRTDNVEAYNYELRGRQLASALTKSDLALARRMFSKAAELDPNYARAYAGMVICDCYLRDWHGQVIPADAILPTADKAVDLDPALPEAHTARGFALFCNEKYDEADHSYRQALSIDPNSYEANFFFASTIARFRDDREKMVSLFKQAARLRPDDYVSPMMIAGFVDKSAPERLAWARACVERAERAAQLRPGNASPLHRGAVALAYLGNRDKAHLWLARALAIDPEEFIAQVNAASVHALFGEVEEALHYLEMAARKVPQNTIDMLRNDADFDAIRHHPRFWVALRPRHS